MNPCLKQNLTTHEPTIDVLEMLLVAVLLSIHALVIFCPGAKTSTTASKLEKDARASAIVVAPTVFVLGAQADDVFPALAPSFPAATAIWIPVLVN